MATQNQMLNYSPIGMVSILMGIGLVEGPDGLTRFLQVGDELHAEDTVSVVGKGDAEITFLDGTRNNVQGGDSLYLDSSQFNMDHVPEDEGDFRIVHRSDVLDPELEDDLATWLQPFAGVQPEQGVVPAVAEDISEQPLGPDYSDAMLGLGWLMAGTDECFSLTSVDDSECDLPTEFG